MKRKIFRIAMTLAWFLAGFLMYRVVGGFREIFLDLYGSLGSLPFATRVVFGVGPIGWFSFFVIAGLASFILSVNPRPIVEPAFVICMVVTFVVIVISLFMPVGGTLLGQIEEAEKVTVTEPNQALDRTPQ
ncbi:hypothetical protein ACFLS1_04660 [Verrucomicrobiota bacterium]